VENEGVFQVEPVHIIDQKFKVLRNKAIRLVNIQWTCFGPKDASWEHEETMREEYTHMFLNFKGKIN